jgi:phenylalanyl-tRNA synthetase beta chain
MDSAGEILENLTLFDVYSGVGIDLETKSIAYRLTYRLHTRTLTDVEVDSSLAYILNILGQQFGAQLRA